MSAKLDLVTDLLQQVISSSNSQTSSIKSSDISERIKSTTAKTQKGDINADGSDGQDDRIGTNGPKPQSTNLTTVSDESLGHAAEFKTLFRATKSLVNSFHQLYHPLIAEFLSTMHAFVNLDFQSRYLRMELLANTWAYAYDRNAGLNEVTQLRRAAAFQLLSLRKKCIFEGLGDTLELMMSRIELPIKKLLEECGSLTRQEFEGQKRLQLGELGAIDPDEQWKDRLTRTNEWMLGVFYAFPYFIELHRQIMDWTEITQRETLHFSLLHRWTKTCEPAYEENARRTIVKFWFLDSAAMSEKEYASSYFTSSDSDATFRVLDEEDEEDEADEEDGSSEDTVSQAYQADLNMTMRKKTSLMLSLQSHETRGLDLVQEQIAHDSPPDEISRKALAAARKAVADYCQEPSAHVTTEEDRLKIFFE